uniref:RNA-directed DNA polymerase n=1 Tax=Globodera rostochiensis TaxID=31243 RepID=A0A914GZI6_GLORO
MRAADDPNAGVPAQNQACGLEAIVEVKNEGEPTIAVISKKFWAGKSTVRVSDMENAHAEILRLEDGVNRALRLVNRSLNLKGQWVNQVVSNANANFETLKVQVNTLAERVDDLERANESTEASETHYRHTPTFVTPLDGRQGDRGEDRISEDEQEEEDRAVYEVNMLSNNLTIGSSLEVFGEESLFAFEDWAERFKDYLSVSGKNWTDEEKVTRLKLALKDTPRALFKELLPAQIRTVDDALNALRAKMDSPQRREIAKRTLSLCKQREDETVVQFLRRLSPLVEATNPSLSCDQRKEKVCEEFLDRLKPNMSFLIRLVGLTQAKNLEVVKAQAQELEALLLANKGDEISRFTQVVNAMRDQPAPAPAQHNPAPPPFSPGTSGSSGGQQHNSNWRNSGGQQNSNTWGFRPFTSSDVQRQRFNNRGRGNFQNWGRGRQEGMSQRNWSSSPVCYHCHRTGHLAYACNARRAQFQTPRGRGANWTQQQQRPRMAWQNQTGAVNVVQPAQSSSSSPGFMEDLVRSLINMNVKNSSNRTGGNNEDSNPGSMNAIMQIKGNPSPIKKVASEEKKSSEPKIDPACGRETIEPPRPRISNWESSAGGKLSNGLFIVATMMIVAFFMTNPTQAIRPDNPLVCQTQKEGRVWQLPEVIGCHKITLDPAKPLVTRTLKVYSPNEFEHIIDAWACRRVVKAVRKYTSITNVPIQETIEPISKEVSPEECRQMVEHGKCSLGVLINESGLLHTDKRIDISPRMWLIGSFGWTIAESENCYLFRTKVTVERGSDHVQTPAGETNGCIIRNGHCILSDRTTVMWEKNVSRRCEYELIGTFKGMQMDNAWISDEATFRLTFQNASRKVYSCGMGLQKTEEGFAVKDVPEREQSRTRARRSLVTESEMDAKLGFLDDKVMQVMKISFSRTVKSICEYMVETRRWAASALLSDPTNFARTLLNSVGKEEGAEECFELIPIKLRMRSGGEKLAFVDPRTLTITSTSRIAPCAEFRNQLIFIGGTLLEVDQLTAQVKQVQAHSFHRMALINVSDILAHVYDASMAKVSEITFGLHSKDTIVTKTMSEQWEEVRDQVEDKIFGGWLKLGRTVLAIMVVIVFGDFLVRFGLMLKDEYKGQREEELKEEEVPRIRVKEGKNLTCSSSAQNADDEEPAIELTPIKLIESVPPVSLIGSIVKWMRCRWQTTMQSKTSQFEDNIGTETQAEDSENLGKFFKRRFGDEWRDTKLQEVEAHLRFLLRTSHQLRPSFPPQRFLSLIAIKSNFEVMPLVVVRNDEGAHHQHRVFAVDQVELARNYVPNLGTDYQVSAISPQTAVVVASINNLQTRCLMDTGASLSVAPRSVANELQCELLPSDKEAMSASGHVIKLKEFARLKLKLAGEEVWITLNFVEDSEFTASKEYNVIIGSDVFVLLPPIGFDYGNKLFSVGKSKIKFCHQSSVLMSSIRVHLSENTCIPKDSQVLVKAKIETLSPTNNPVVIDRTDSSLVKEGLAVLNSISPAGLRQIKVALVNPTMEPKTLWKGMHLAYANEVVCDATGLFREDTHKQIMVLQNDTSTMTDPTFVVDYSKASVSDEELKELKALIEEYADAFSKSQYDLGMFSAAEHHITTTSEEPVSSPPRRMPYKYREELKKHIDQLLASGVMVESDTPWVTPIVVVQKKDGGIRPCLDFRKLNEVTIPDRYPLPRLDSIMERVGGCKFYTSLDLASGFLQIKLSEETSRKCGVITEDRVYQMLTMPFGMKNATAAFSRAMTVVLSGLENIALAYVDDILIFTKEGTFSDHLAALRKVLDRFRLFNLKLSPRKCVFASKEMNFLGFTLTAGGFKPSLSRIEIIKEMEVPTNVKGVKHVLGKAGFYRRHIENFAMVVEPLLQLTRQGNKFEWGMAQQQAFDKIKDLLTQAPNLIFPDYSKPFHIFTDASTVGQGGVLMQKNELSGTFSAISYCSRTLSVSERKWPAVQVELSAIVYALREFRPFIFMSDVELHTDHKPLAYLLKKSDSSPQLGRWLIELQNYQIKIVHIAGKQNSLADALSRAMEDKPLTEVQNVEELGDIVEFPVCLVIAQHSRVVLDPFVRTLTLRHQDGNSYEVDLADELTKDPEAEAYIRFVQTGEFPEGLDEREKDEFAAATSNLILDSGILYFKEPNQQARIYVPISLRGLIFESFHSSLLGGGHLNYRKTVAKCRKYFWPKMHSDIITWIRLCITCQLRHHPTPAYREEMMMVPANSLFARVGLDLAGPFPTTQKGNKHILNIVCWFTKYIVSVALPDAKANTIAQAFFTNCYLKFGGCIELVTDNATAFTSDFFREFCALLYINKKYATPHWSQGNAATERTFRTFHNIMAKYITRDQPDFDEFLNAACFCYNTSVHASTGESPFFLMFGRDPIFCVDQILDPKIRDPVALSDRTEFKQKLVVALRRAWSAASEVHKQAQLKMKEQYDKKARPQGIQIGDRVLIRNYDGRVGTSKKFQLPWKGIYRVVELDNIHATVISCSSPQSKPKTIHLNQLKRCFEMLGPPCTLPAIPDEEQTALEGLEADAKQASSGQPNELPEEDSQASEVRQIGKKQACGPEAIEYEHEECDNSPRYNLRPRVKRW